MTEILMHRGGELVTRTSSILSPAEQTESYVPVSHYFKRRKMFPTQEIKEERPDGSWSPSGWAVTRPSVIFSSPGSPISSFWNRKFQKRTAERREGVGEASGEITLVRFKVDFS